MTGRNTASAVVIRAVRDVPAFRKGLWVTLALIALGTVAQLVVPLFLQRLTDSGALSESASAEIVLSTHLFDASGDRGGRVGRVVESLAAAVERGLEVIVVLEIGREASPITRANRATARLLQERGVRVYADMSGTTVHSRLAVIDRRLAFVGSHDLTVQSLGRYRETTLLVDSPVLALDLLRFVESLEPVPYR